MTRIDITKEDMKQILEEVEHFVDSRLATYSWRLAGFIIIPMVLVSVAWGVMYNQVQKNTDIIKNTVLTVKDKDNLDIKINNISETMNKNNASVIKAIDELRNEIRGLR